MSTRPRSPKWMRPIGAILPAGTPATPLSRTTTGATTGERDRGASWSFVEWMVTTHRLPNRQLAWTVLQDAHRQAMSYGRSKTQATEYLDRLLRTARKWGLRDVRLFLDIEINHRRMRIEEARQLCGWRQE